MQIFMPILIRGNVNIKLVLILLITWMIQLCLVCLFALKAIKLIHNQEVASKTALIVFMILNLPIFVLNLALNLIMGMIMIQKKFVLLSVQKDSLLMMMSVKTLAQVQGSMQILSPTGVSLNV